MSINIEILLQRNKQDQCFEVDQEGFLKATKDLKKGDLILEEVPLIRAPVKSTLPVCLGCFTPIDWQNCVYCSNCNFPLCCEECKDSTEHQMECQYFGDVKVDGENFNYSTFEPMYDVILPLRVLSLKGTSGWQSFMTLRDHKDELMNRKDWKQNHQKAIEYILETLKLKNITNEDELLTIFAIDHVNGFDQDFSSYKVRLLHPLSTLLSHSCQANVERYYSGLYNGNNLQCRAAVDIGKGQKLSISFTDILNPTLIRQRILKQQHFIECRCERCMDQTDLGTHGNSLLCQKCPDGTVLPQQWKCDKCKSLINEKEFNEVIEKAFDDAQDLTQDINKWTVENYELFLSKYAKILHPNHVFMTKIKSKLAGFYGRLPGYTMLDMSMNRSLLDRKLEMCVDALKNLEQLQRGLGSLKAALLYEYHIPLFMAAKLDMDSDEYNTTPIATPEQKEQFNNAVKFLEQSIDLLQYELEGTYENSLYYGAQGSLAQLKMFIDQLW